MFSKIFGSSQDQSGVKKVTDSKKTDDVKDQPIDIKEPARPASPATDAPPPYSAALASPQAAPQHSPVLVSVPPIPVAMQAPAPVSVFDYRSIANTMTAKLSYTLGNDLHIVKKDGTVEVYSAEQVRQALVADYCVILDFSGSQYQPDRGRTDGGSRIQSMADAVRALMGVIKTIDRDGKIHVVGFGDRTVNLGTFTDTEKLVHNILTQSCLGDTDMDEAIALAKRDYLDSWIDRGAPNANFRFVVFTDGVFTTDTRDARGALKNPFQSVLDEQAKIEAAVARAFPWDTRGTVTSFLAVQIADDHGVEAQMKMWDNPQLRSSPADRQRVDLTSCCKDDALRYTLRDERGRVEEIFEESLILGQIVASIFC